MLSRHVVKQIIQTITARSMGVEAATTSRQSKCVTLQMRSHSRDAGVADTNACDAANTRDSINLLLRDIAVIKWCTVLSTSAIAGVCASTVYDYVTYGTTLVLPITVHTRAEPHSHALAQ